MMNLLVISVVLCTLTLSYAAPVRVNLTLSGEMSKRSSQGFCIKYIYVMAFTSALPDAASNHAKFIGIKANGKSDKNSFALLELPNLPGDDYKGNKGDFWKVYIPYSECVTAEDIGEISIANSGSDGWNIDSVVTFVASDQHPLQWQLSSVDLGVNQWIDDQISGAQNFPLTLTQPLKQGFCIKYLYVMAFTSGLPGAESDDAKYIVMKVNGKAVTDLFAHLPDLPGDDYSKNKGDLWQINIHFSECVTAEDIGEIAIANSGSDGWNINSIVTFVTSDRQHWKLSSVDLDVNQWIDDEIAGAQYFPLTLTL
ncbi:uncharacterized protein [Dysidea avara]|uniref:uncharacterized protein n=1 Tax=Dysidea avara TaxID=196820 RepID=UPI003332B112